MLNLSSARSAFDKLVRRAISMHFALVATMLQVLLTGGALGVSVLLNALGMVIPASNIEGLLQFSPAFAYWTAILVAPVIESILIIVACKIASKIFPRFIAIAAVAVVFSLSHDMPSPAGYLILLWVGLLFCAANELAIERRFPFGARLGWLTAAHAVYNGCAIAIYLQSSMN
jgi:hypothetical protein